MIHNWINISDPSPSPKDTVIARDRDGNLQRKMQVRQENEKIEYETVQQRYYTQTNDLIYVNQLSQI